VRAFDGAVERDERLVDGAIVLPAAGKRSFWLNGSAWELPTYDNFDVFLRRLGRKGEVSKDQAVEATLLGRPTGLSLRSLQRRIRQTTGLTQVAIKQIDRAERAVALLESGATILDVVERLGYADQPHLTRSLRRFIGQTPKEILNDEF
jgi:AraC-like DNA-binding protein